jgi:hypothetical protein
VFDQGVGDRLEQRQQPLQAAGDGSGGQVEAVAPPVGEQALGGAIEPVFVEQDVDPDGDAEGALGDQPWRRRRGEDAGLGPTGTRGTVAAAVAEAAVGLDLDLQDGGVVGAGEGGEGLSAALAAALLRGQRA